MKFDYSDANVVQGRANQDMAKEQPNTFATESGADRVRQVTPPGQAKAADGGEMGNDCWNTSLILMKKNVLMRGCYVRYPMKVNNLTKLKWEYRHRSRMR